MIIVKKQGCSEELVGMSRRRLRERLTVWDSLHHPSPFHLYGYWGRFPTLASILQVTSSIWKGDFTPSWERKSILLRSVWWHVRVTTTFPKCSFQKLVFLDGVPYIPRDSPSHPRVKQLLLLYLCSWNIPCAYESYQSLNHLGHFSKRSGTPIESILLVATWKPWLPKMYIQKKHFTYSHDFRNTTVLSFPISIFSIHKKKKDAMVSSQFHPPVFRL